MELPVPWAQDYPLSHLTVGGDRGPVYNGWCPFLFLIHQDRHALLGFLSHRFAECAKCKREMLAKVHCHDVCMATLSSSLLLDVSGPHGLQMQLCMLPLGQVRTLPAARPYASTLNRCLALLKWCVVFALHSFQELDFQSNVGCCCRSIRTASLGIAAIQFHLARSGKRALQLGRAPVHDV